MAAQHLTVLTHPEFPQVLDGSLSRLDQMVTRVLAKTAVTYLLGQCNFEDEYCDCREPATVHHLESEQEFCLRHFQAVTRG